MTTKEMIAVMQAFEEGKTIECRSCEMDIISHEAGWSVNINPIWDWSGYEYRIKQEPKYRPYKDCKEFVKDATERMEQIKHPFGGIWLMQKVNKLTRQVTEYSSDTIALGGADWWKLSKIFDDYTYLDGTPFGIKE